ncbi:MAG: hypothetical protein AAF637_05990 [Pseudomonadota bacterium]
MIPPDARRPYQEIVEFLLTKLQDTGVLTDHAPGSVVRTLVEATSREFSEFYGRMNAVYESGFIDTATGKSLDQLVALLGVTRISGEASVADLRLIRDKRISARVIVPIGTEIAVTRAVGDRVIYQIADDYELREGEESLVVSIRALPEGDQTQEDVALSADDAALGAIAMTQPIAGIGGLSLEGPSVALGVQESDEQLRERTKMAISAAGGGTEKALTDALMSVPIVKAVQLRDASDLDELGQPVVPPGELEIVLDAPEDQLAIYQDQIAEAIETHKGPGILARVSTTSTKTLSGTIVIKPASDALTGGQTLKLVADCEDIVKGEVEALPIGGTLVWNRVLAKLMNVENLADVDTAQGGLSLGGGAPAFADVSVTTFERMILGEGVEAIAVLPDAQPVVTLGLTVSPQSQEPDGDTVQALEDELVVLLTAHIEALNAAPIQPGRKVMLTQLVDEISTPGALSLPVSEIPAGTVQMVLTDLAERSELTLVDGGTTELALNTDVLIKLADPPVTLVWEPETP